MVSTLVNAFSVLHYIKIDTYDWHVFPVVIYQSDRNYIIVH